MVQTLDITVAAQQLGLSNLPVCGHSSLRSFGWVEGGADAVINGLADLISLAACGAQSRRAGRQLTHDSPFVA